MNSIRAFIALDIPSHIQEEIEKQTSRLRKTMGEDSVRWVPPNNMHLTLKFLGNIPTSHVDFLKAMMTQASALVHPFEIHVIRFGSFPNSKRPHVLWAGIHAAAELLSLQKKIEDGATRLGYEKEVRSFSPHLTIGRVRQGLPEQDLRKISNALFEIQHGKIGTTRVDSIHLYQSDLNSEGSIYTKLFSTTLR